ncbi:MAG: uroporphyrinogen-III C-methyltransferase [Cyclobacteriaceae bacterium]|nr:uroporphyrinogen-III C-methyltransferase [Cyclobacteriaceae bacterium]
MIQTSFVSHQSPRLTLVGAGPGDPELITLKGINALKTADIVLYDALVSEEILNNIPVGIPSFCVGKRAGSHSFKQEEINELIVEFAYLYGHVVRLKGGDPFVFARGSEEIAFAESRGITTFMVPGISSALAVPASLNIPVTARGICESFWVVTGTTKEGAISADIALAAQSSATIVILMGLNKIREIMEQFVSCGKNEIPVAVIQNGTLSNQKSVIGNASTIGDLAMDAGIGSPAIIVVGEVVNHAHAREEIAQEIGIQCYKNG